MLEGTIRILKHYSYGISRLSLYKNEQSRLDQINSIESLLRQAPFPLEPNSNQSGFILNSRGFRTPEYQEDKAPNTKRIIVIGDSFTYSSGYVPYPYHFTVVIEAKLNQLIKNGSFEMINLGIPAIGPKFEQRILELEGIRLHPDLIIWFFFVGNDFYDDVPSSKEYKASLTDRLLMKCYLCRVIRNGSILYSYKNTMKANMIEKIGNGPGGSYIGSVGAYDPDKPSFPKDEFLQIQADRMSIFSQKTFSIDQWRYVQQILTEVRDMCRFFKIPLLIVIIPDENQVNPDLLKEVVKKLGKTVNDFQMDYPQMLLTEFFENNGIDYLDLLPVFKKVGGENILYHFQDTHWNIEGNKLAAEAVVKYIIRMKDHIN